MVQSLKYGILTGFGFAVVIATMALLAIFIEHLAGDYDAVCYLSTQYIIAGCSGMMAAFICGFIYPPLLSKSITKYSKEYPDVPQKYVREISRGKLLLKYFFNISWICFACAFPLIMNIDEYPLLSCILMSCGFSFLFAYAKNRKRYENL